MITVRTENLVKVHKKLQMVAARVKDMSPVMAGASARMLKDVKKHFEEEVDDKGKKWVRWNRKMPDGTRKFFNSRPYKPGGNKMLSMSGGGLKNSIRHKSTRKTAEVFTDRNYAGYHQSGTKKMVKRKFMYISKSAIRIIMDKLESWSVGK